jgi:hypothetical protein
MADDGLIWQMAETIGAGFWLADANEPHILYVSNAYEKIGGRDPECLYDEGDFTAGDEAILVQLAQKPVESEELVQTLARLGGRNGGRGA